jgi:hypothetical protein
MARGSERYHAWIPTERAVVGEPVRLIDDFLGAPLDAAGFSIGWTVHTVWPGPRLAAYAKERSRDYTRTRKASDV